MLRRPSAFLPLCLLLVGCGGSSSSSSGVRPQVTVAWPARSRDVAAPGSALSAVVVFRRAAADGSDLSFVAERPSGTAATIQTYVAPRAVRRQTAVMEVTFQTDHGGSGYVVATAVASIAIGADGALLRPGGEPLGNVGFVGLIDSISVVAPDGVDAGATTELTATVSALGGVIAVTPGSIALSVTAGGDHLRAAGGTTVTGLSEGEATVVATVDGISSPATLVDVNGPALAARTIPLVTSKLVYDPRRSRIWAALPPAGDTGNAIVALDPATGAHGAPIPVGPNPTAMAISDDGSTMFVGIQGDGAVRPVDLDSGTPGTAFALTSASPFGDAVYAVDLAVVPGSNSAVAAALGSVGSSGTYGPYVYDDGVRRPDGPTFYGGTRLVFTSPTRLVAADPELSPESIYDYRLDAQGVTLQRSRWDAFLGYASDIVARGDRVYASDGSVLDGTTLNRVGSLLGDRVRDYSNPFYGPAVDADAGRAYFVSVSGSQVRLLGFRTDTFAKVLNRRISGLDTAFAGDQRGGADLLRWGASGLAFRAGDRVVFLDGVPGV